MFSMFRAKKPVKCEEDMSAFRELSQQVPLVPKQNSEKGFDTYRWGYEKVPDSQLKGVPTFNEKLDANNHGVARAPFPTDRRGFHAGKEPEDRINTQYDNMLGDQMSLSKPAKASFNTKYEKMLAYHHGLYQPSTQGPAKSADDVRLATSDFNDKVHQDAPTDACKYILMEEMRCLQVHQYEKQPSVASGRCVKWFEEHAKCQWDQHKFNNGYTFIEGPQLMKKRRPYIFYPSYNYA